MDKVNAFLNSVKDLPAFPKSAIEFMKLSKDPKTSLHDIGKFISKDTTLSTKILKLANSPFYNRGREIKSINQAVVLLGLDIIKGIVLSLSVIRIFPLEVDGREFDRTLFWDHSVASAFIAKKFSKEFSLWDPEEAYTAALIHDIGKLLYNQFFPDDYTKVIKRALSEDKRYIEIEKEEFGYTHADFGFKIAEKWNLPIELKESIRYHHGLEEETKNKLLVAIVGFSNIFSKQIGYNFPWEFEPFVLSENVFWQEMVKHNPKLKDIDEAFVTFEMREMKERIEALIKESLEG